MFQQLTAAILVLLADSCIQPDYLHAVTVYALVGSRGGGEGREKLEAYWSRQPPTNPAHPSLDTNNNTTTPHRTSANPELPTFLDLCARDPDKVQDPGTCRFLYLLEYFLNCGDFLMSARRTAGIVDFGRQKHPSRIPSSAICSRLVCYGLSALQRKMRLRRFTHVRKYQ